MTNVLVTSACGYLGRHVASELRSQGHDVVAYDDGLPDRWTGAPTSPPDDARFIRGLPDDQAQLETAMHGVDAVIHLTSPEHPLDGDRSQPIAPLEATKTLLRAMTATGVARLVLQSSLGCYGEGRYIDADGMVQVARRTKADLNAGRWDPAGPDGRALAAVPTPEDATVAPMTAAAALARAQERLVRRWAAALTAQVSILRLGRLFGMPATGGNSFTGEIGLMVARILQGERPLVLEDGGQIHDWLHVRDAARAIRLGLEHCDSRMPAMNISSGEGHSAAQAARLAAVAAFAYEIEPEPIGLACAGAGRHLIGQPGAARDLLGFSPEIPLQNGLGELVHWSRQTGIGDRAVEMLRDLARADRLIGPGAIPG